MLKTTRRMLILAVACGLALAGCSKSGGAASPAVGDMTMGKADAPVKVVEYASATCPHCARFNAEVFPAFKAKYVDTGKVRYTLREMLTPPAEVAAAGFMLARCAGPKNYFKVVDAVFASQSKWDGDIKPIFQGIARDNGLTDAQFEACLTNPDNIKGVNARVKAAIDAGVSSTPTFFINGVKYEGEQSLEKLDAAIAAAKKK
jgi:protein-disulfide isomerase